MPKGSILVVDDEAEIREGLKELLASENFEVTLAETGTAGLAKLEERPFDLVLLDVSLPDRNGIDMLREIRQRDPNLAIIQITAFGSIDMARAAFKSGAQDYITKPWNNDELVAQVSLAVEGRRLREENVHLKRALKQRYNFPSIVGKSEKMLAVLDLVAQVAPSRSTVLINGESGTGKELIAKAIHSASTRADKAFIPVNTGSIPIDLLESQLFGHVKGAFTSAVASKKGLFEVADQGTIFFDATALVNAPLTWPKSCDSSRSTGIDPVFTGMNALSARVDAEWMALATSSLPVPLSPEISTVERDGATCATRSSTASIFSLLPTMFGKL